MVAAETPCSTSTSCPSWPLLLLAGRYPPLCLRLLLLRHHLELNRHQPSSRLRAPRRRPSHLRCHSSYSFLTRPQQLPHPRHRIPRRNESHEDFSTTHSQSEEQQSSPTHLSQSTTSSQIPGVSRKRRKKHCIVEGCPEHIAPSMWRAHMTLHIQGVFSGDVPNFWLEENDFSICHLCHQLVSNNRLSSHPRKCVGGAVVAPVLDSVLRDVPHNLAEMSLPTFEDVCLLD